MTRDDLLPFCADSTDDRECFRQPWSRGDYTYATNGHVLIRVPRLADVEDGTGPLPSPIQSVDALVQPADGAQWLPVPTVEMLAPVPCGWCGGIGKSFSECFCGGTGESNSIVRVTVGEVDYQARYLALLCRLPHCEIAPNGLKTAAIRFDGGVGALMPLRGETR